jgi:O-antigen/teichoic acid export membrane protein
VGALIARYNSKLIRNSLSLTATEVGGRIIRFLYLLAIARVLGPENTGVYLYGIALYLSVIGVSQFGQYIFLSLRVGKHGGVPMLVLHHSLTLILMATLTVAGSLALFVWVSEPEVAIRLAMWCFVGALVARVVAGWVRSAYVAFERPAWVPKFEVIFRGLEALVGIAVLLSGGGLLAISFLHFLFWVIEAVFSLRKLARDYPGALGLGWRWQYLKKASAVSVIFLVSVTAMTLFSQIGIILLRKLQPDGAFVGHLGIAMQFMTTLMIAPMAVTRAFLPRLGRSFSRGGGGRDLITAVKLVGTLALTGAIVGAAYGPWFIVLALGPEYAEAADLFRWLCWVVTPYVVVVLLGLCFNVVAAPGVAMIVSVGMTALHVGFIVAYVDQSPAIAAIGSMLAAALCGMVVALHQVTRILELQGHLWWMKSVFVIASIYAVSESGWAPLMLTAPVALAVGAFLTWQLQIFDADDIVAIRRLLRRTSANLG